MERVLHAEHYGQGERYDRQWQEGRYRSARLIYASTYCEKDRRVKIVELRDQAGWCLVEPTVEMPQFDAVIHYEGYYGTNRNWGRRQMEVWSCGGRCKLVARRTEFKLRRFAVPLRIAYPGGGTYIDPQFQRVAVQRGDADPTSMIKAALGLDLRDGPPRLGEQPIVAANEEAAFRLADAHRKAEEETQRLARLAESNRDRAAQLAQIAHDREIKQRNREPRPGACVMTEGAGLFRSTCTGR